MVGDSTARTEMKYKCISVTGREQGECHQFTTTFQTSDLTSESSVPPAVIRSLKNIRRDVRRDVVVDIAGRNNVR